MAMLNEYCLHHIFNFLTPFEWIQISQVCRLWKSAALKQWKKITEISYLEDELDIKKKRLRKQKCVPVIDSLDAYKIVLGAAPFVKVLRAMSSDYKDCPYVLFGTFWYRVEFLETDTVLTLLARKSTEITELCFDFTPNVELLGLLFKNNKIKKVQNVRSETFHQNIPTETIEDLDIQFVNSEKFRSFKGHFSNVRKLSLDVVCEKFHETEKILSGILPNITRWITSLNLVVDFHFPYSRYYKLLNGFAKFTQLEELSIDVNEFDASRESSGDWLVSEIVFSCRKIRNFKFDGFEISKSSLHSLMSLPRLEKLDIDVVAGFDSKVLPEMKNLTSCKIAFANVMVDVKSICEAVKKMPKLLSLQTYYLNVDESLELICGVAVIAASQDKDLVVKLKKAEHETCTKLEIVRKSAEKDLDLDRAQMTLALLISGNQKKSIFDDVMAFVKTKMKQHTAVLIFDKSDDSSDESSNELLDDSSDDSSEESSDDTFRFGFLNHFWNYYEDFSGTESDEEEEDEDHNDEVL